MQQLPITSISDSMLNKLAGLRVLLVDDDEFNRMVTAETLVSKMENVTVDEAADGLIALEQMRKKTYDVILMDLIMPEMDGFETTHKIRNELPAPLNTIKVLALTASVIKSEIDRCQAAGMNGVIPKPFQFHELIFPIYQQLYGNDQPPVIQKTVSSPANKLVDLNCLDELTEGDTFRKQRLVDLFLSKVPACIKLIKDTWLAEDYEKMRILVHSLKPRLSAMGMRQALEITETIELICYEKTDINKIPALISKLENQCQIAVDELKFI